jgi:hypothetical protein
MRIVLLGGLESMLGFGGLMMVIWDPNFTLTT